MIFQSTVDCIGGRTHYGYIPYLSLDYDMDMNIWQKLHNLWIYAYDYMLIHVLRNRLLHYKETLIKQVKFTSWILEAFSRMPQYNLLWKFEADPKTLSAHIPKNVLIKVWLPQNSILAHEKTKAFITHAGSLRRHETTCICAVPSCRLCDVIIKTKFPSITNL